MHRASGLRSVVRREDDSWLFDGALPVDEFLHVVGIKANLRMLPSTTRWAGLS